MNLKPWREIAVPHEDVLKGEIVQAEFAADISRVHDGSSKAEYQNPVSYKRLLVEVKLTPCLLSII